MNIYYNTKDVSLENLFHDACNDIVLNPGFKFQKIQNSPEIHETTHGLMI